MQKNNKHSAPPRNIRRQQLKAVEATQEAELFGVKLKIRPLDSAYKSSVEVVETSRDIMQRYKKYRQRCRSQRRDFRQEEQEGFYNKFSSNGEEREKESKRRCIRAIEQLRN